MSAAAGALDLGTDPHAVERAEKANERAEQRQSLLDRIELLKLRTAAVGVVGFGVFVAALFSFLGQAPWVWTAWQALWVGTSAIHVPVSLFAAADGGSRLPAVLQLTFFFVAVLGVSALARGGMTQLQERAWQVILVCVLCAAAVLQPSGTGDRKALGELQDALQRQEWNKADGLLQRAPDSLKAKYVQAQISMLRADPQATREHGLGLMVPLELVLLRMYPDGPEVGNGMHASIVEFRPDVLERIDKATYGAAHSEVSIARKNSPLTHDDSPWVQALKRSASFAVAILSLLCSVAVLVLWYRMNNRVGTVRKWAAAGF